MAGDAITLIEQATTRFLDEVPALKPMKLVVGIELREAIGVVRAIVPETGILVGGTGVPLRVGDQPGLRRCERLADVVALVDGLTQRASMN